MSYTLLSWRRSMSPNKIYYYSDEINDEFSGIKREHYRIDSHFKYVNSNFIYLICKFLVYRVVMTPLAYIYLKLKFRIKFVNRKCFKKVGKSGYFLYGNHTNVPLDGFSPTTMSFPRKTFVIVSAENFALKGTRTFMKMVGGVPLPDDFKSMKNFMKCIEKRISSHCVVAIYPEAHIWPYYTKIRPFKSDSFRFPCKYNSPSFCFTTTYQKRKHSKKPRVVIYIDGPFYPDENLDQMNQKEKLRNEIYETMVARSKNSNCEYYTYKKKENN